MKTSITNKNGMFLDSAELIANLGNGSHKTNSPTEQQLIVATNNYTDVDVTIITVNKSDIDNIANSTQLQTTFTFEDGSRFHVRHSI